MKTSVAKKLRNRVLAAFMAIAVMLSYVVPSAITASAAEEETVAVQAYGDGNEYSDQLNFSEFNLSYKGADGEQHFLVDENKAGITPSIEKSTDFTFLFDWDITPGSDLERALNEALSSHKKFEMVCDLSEELKGFSFGDSLVTGETVEITDIDGKLSVTFSFKGTTLYICVNEKGERTTNYKGNGKMNGSISLEKNECATNGEAELKFFDKECKVIVSDYAPDVNVVKESAGIVEKDGELYLKFKTVITAKNDVKDIYLDDEFTYDGHVNSWGGTDSSIYKGDKLEDIKVTAPDGSSGSVDVQENADGKARLYFKSLEAGETVIEYLIKANPASNDNSTNHAFIKDSSNTVLSQDDAWVMIQTPQVSKSNGGLKGGDEVEWTITVEKNVLNELKDSKDFTVTDKPQAGIDEASMKAAMEQLGATGSFADGYEIPFSAFTDNGDGTYTLSYTTKVTEDFLNTLSGKTVTNKVTAEFEDLIDVPDDTFKGESNLHIEGIGEVEISKEMYASKGGVFSWRSTINVPRCDLDMIEITDNAAWNNWDSKTYVTHRVLPDSIKVNGKPLKDVAAEDSFTNSKEFANYKFGFKFSDEYIKQLNDELADDAEEFVITIEYDTQAVDEDGNFVDEYNALSSITNKMSVTARAKNEDIPVNKEVTCTVDPEFKVSKEVVSWSDRLDTSGLTNPLMWRVNINSYDNTAADKIFEEGKVITVTDTLPKGYELGDYVLCIGDSQYSFDHTTKDGVKVTKTVDKDGRQVVTFEVTVTEDILKHLKQGEWSTSPRTTWDIAIEYSTGMTEEYAAEFMMTHKNEEVVSFVNSADVFYDGGLIGNNLEATGNVKVNIHDILTKELIEAEAGKMFGTDEKGNYVLFKITLNPDELPIGGYDENGDLLYETLTAEDTLGTSMTYGGDVTGLLPGDEVKVSKSGRKLQFILKNKKAYTITYKARIVGTKDTLTSEEEAKRYSNVVAITCDKITSDNTSATVAASVYKFLLTVSADTERAYFTISGTKTWDDNGNVYRPDHITLKMVRHNLTDKNAEDEEFTITVGKAFDCDVTLEEDEIDGNKWSFTVDEPSLLYTRLGDIEYSYSITEATDNKGYTLKNITADLGNITNDDIADPKEVTLEITNEMVKTSVSGTKTWIDNSNAAKKRPASLKIYLYANGKAYAEQSISGTGDEWTYEFKDLPKCDASGKEIVYTVSEGTVPGYTAQQKGEYDFINRLRTASVEVLKVDENGDPVTGAHLQLYDTAGLADEWTTNGAAHKVNVVAGETYTLKEKEAPEGYELADDMEFTAPTEGTVTWTMIDKKTPEKPKEKPKASILKVDEDGKPLAGAQLAVLCDGKEVESWTTDGKAKEIELEAGKEYILRELNAPEGYEKAADVKFTAPAAGKTVEVKMFDSKKPQQPEEPKPTKVEITINKKWVGGTERPDVTVTLSDGNGYSKNLTLNADNSWTVTVKDLPKFDGKGNEITYTVIEKKVENYDSVVTNDGYTFTVTNTYKPTPQQPEEPKPTKVEISKKDITNGKELPGAKLKVVDKDGNVIKEWTSTDKPTYFENVFEAGETYTLIEETAPDGYTVAEKVKFTVKADGTLTTVEMFDSKKPQQPEEPKPTKVEISKKDITNGKELPGAKLKVVDKNGKVIKEWVSTDKPTYFENVFKAGETYTLIEETAPDGYTVAEEVKFTVKADGTLTTVEMFDSKKPQQPEEPKPTKVEISKKDITNGKELPGAKLKVVDKDGNVIKEWVSTDKPTYFENVFEAGETYTLIEETAPDGYTIAEKVEFTVKENGELTVVEMFDAVKTGTDTDNDSNDKDSGVAQGGGSNDKVTDNDDSPKTGSSCNITLVMLALALGVMAVTNKKRRNR